MRIIAGTARGRSLAGPKYDGLRPTSDKTRQVVFDLLGQSFEGGAVLDLYCGTGAMALEALSRGCLEAVCVDSDARAVDLALANATALGFAGQVTAVRKGLPEGLPSLPKAERRLIFADPPYEGAEAALRNILRWAGGSGILASDGVLVIETSRHSDFDETGAPGLVRTVRRTVGEAVLHLYKRGN